MMYNFGSAKYGTRNAQTLLTPPSPFSSSNGSKVIMLRLVYNTTQMCRNSHDFAGLGTRLSFTTQRVGGRM